MLLDTARYAPSAHNSQNVHFTVIEGKGLVRSVGKDVMQFYSRILAMMGNPFSRRLLKIAAGRGNYKVLEELKGRLRGYIALYKSEGVLEIVWDAPVLILVHGPKDYSTSVNCSLACSYIMLQAEAVGLGTCILGFLQGGINRVRKKLVRRGIAIPADHIIYIVLSLGRPAAYETYKKMPPRRMPNVQYFS